MILLNFQILVTEDVDFDLGEELRLISGNEDGGDEVKLEPVWEQGSEYTHPSPPYLMLMPAEFRRKL